MGPGGKPPQVGDGSASAGAPIHHPHASGGAAPGSGAMHHHHMAPHGAPLPHAPPLPPTPKIPLCEPEVHLLYPLVQPYGYGDFEGTTLLFHSFIY